MNQNLTDCIYLNISKLTIGNLSTTVSLQLLDNFQTEFILMIVFIGLISLSAVINLYINVKSYKKRDINRLLLINDNNDK